MAEFDLSSNIDAALGFAAKLHQDQMPFATARALTKTQQLVKANIEAEMPRVFDNPTRYTLNSLYLQPATKQDLSARVWFKDVDSGGRASTKFLGPEVYGGERRYKAFDRALQAAGIMPAGMVAVPGSAVELDEHGNVPPALIVQILSYFNAFPQKGYRANMTQRRRDNLARGKSGVRGFTYFALARPEGKLPAGIYRRMDYGADKRIAHLQHGGAKPMFLFVSLPSYRVRLDFHGIAQRVTEAEFPRLMVEYFEQAVATAR
ncbi:hypothetical protein [Cupriavidus malaysiensis]|uniref:Uncharacterized protein n=1 Tax=Cupriavidus malaysiensis TaxID=367825 RepID=A0ABM6F3P5_9BURK|nr:hypothetical protein [Cupriavidus malaysiensis]AOZ05954.1 hypothetical protein BKK80_09030 [Cupriavidus malaysiensis]